MLYAGVDLGGTNIKVALVTEEGKVVCEDSRFEEKQFPLGFRFNIVDLQ